MRFYDECVVSRIKYLTIFYGCEVFSVDRPAYECVFECSRQRKKQQQQQHIIMETQSNQSDEYVLYVAATNFIFVTLQLNRHERNKCCTVHNILYYLAEIIVFIGLCIQFI